MSKVRFSISTSLDGFAAGPNQSVENPLGVGGSGVHTWALALAAWRESHGLPGGEVNASTQVAREAVDNTGAVVMGRNMFGGHPGPWRADAPWNGWWGENPPFHCPVFVVTHHPRAPLTLQGGTTFHFVTEGAEAAVAQARRAAGGKDVVLGGGASLVQQCLRAKLVDEFTVSVAPVLLHTGERLFANLSGADLSLEQVSAIDAPGIAHLKYRVVKG
jgi:dihydrofolate reductase